VSARFGRTSEPGGWIEDNELVTRSAVQGGSKDKQVAPAAQAGEPPDQRNVARFEYDDNFRGSKWRFGFGNFEFDGGRAKPANAGFLADDGQAVLEPAQSVMTFADVEMSPGCEPADDQDHNDDEHAELRRH